MEPSGFKKLLSRNVIHIHEMILLSLDYATFKNCLGVCKPWNDLLASESFGKKAYSVYHREMDLELLLHTKLGKVERVKSLLQKGANPNSSKQGLTPLICSSFIGHIWVVKLLLDQRADPNKANIHGTTPLQVSASKHHIDVMELLIKAGADPNKADNRGNTPLHYSALSGHKTVVKVLLDGGAHPSKPNSKGVTPLSIAENEGNQEMVELIRNAGAANP